MEKIVEKIHHDINTAYLDKFQTCSEVIDREKVESQKYDIAKLGFKSYESEIEKFEKIKQSKEYIEVINRLKIEYPYKKFITYDQIGKILEKYPLVLDTPERFIGTIPTNCMKDILNFKLQKHDEGYSPVPVIQASYKSVNKSIEGTISIVRELLNTFGSRNRIRFFDSEDIGREERSRAAKVKSLKDTCGDYFVESILSAMGLNTSSSYCKDSFTINNCYFKLRRDELGTRLSEFHSLLNSDYDINVYPSEIEFNKPSFWILATADQFDIKPSEIVVGGCIKEVGQGDSLVLLKDDPIIFKPIKEGLIVVTQWGAEAKLPEFTNSSNN